MQDKEVLTVKEAAEFLGLKPFTMRMYARKDVCPKRHRAGIEAQGQWRFIKSDLLEWLRRSKRSAAPAEEKAV